jgi:hypothetical protein
MWQKKINVIALSAIGALVLAGVWFYLIEPSACPVPAGLLSQPGPAPCFEFWFARYQALVAAILAIVGVAYATKPVLRQVYLLERQQLEARYKMTSDLQRYLANDWISPVPHPGTKEFRDLAGANTEERKAFLLEARRLRQERIASFLADLLNHPMDNSERTIVESWAPKFREVLSSTLTTEADSGIAQAADMYAGWTGDPDAVLSGIWFSCVDLPDNRASQLKAQLSRDLDAAKAGIVSQMVTR